MHLQHLDAPRIKVTGLQAHAHDLLLGRSMRRSQGTGSSVLVYSSAPQHHGVLLGSILEWAQHRRDAGLSTHVSISGCVQGLAPAVRGQHARSLNRSKGIPHHHYFTSTRHSSGNYSQNKSHAGHVRSYQRRGAGSINCCASSM